MQTSACWSLVALGAWLAAFVLAPLPADSACCYFSAKAKDVARGKEVDDINLAPSSDFARCVAFAPDGRSFLAGTAGWVILRFELLNSVQRERR